MEICVIKIKFNGKTEYALWCSGEQEEFAVKNGRILLFFDEESAGEYVKAKGSELSKVSDNSYDMDVLQSWCDGADIPMSDYSILKFWEFFCDVSYTVSGSFASSGRSFVLNDIYDKLCMMIYAADDDERFSLDESEYDLIKGVLSEGIRMFTSNVIR